MVENVVKYEEMKAQVDKLAEDPSTEPYIGDADGGFVVIDGKLNADQLRIIADWLDWEEED